MEENKKVKESMLFIGVGNMGLALLEGIIRSGRYDEKAVVAADVYPDRREMASKLGVTVTADVIPYISEAEIVFLCVKPQSVDKLLRGIGDLLEGKIVVSIVAGVSISHIMKRCRAVKVVRSMPNLPCMVGEGAVALSYSQEISFEDKARVRNVMESCARVVEVEEDLMDAVTGLSGTGPMYIFLIVEALSDAGVMMGLSRKDASILAVQTVLGSAKMIRDVGEHPNVLKDKVTSPAGTAIHALHSLEKTGMRADLMDAIKVATERSRELGTLFEKNHLE